MRIKIYTMLFIMAAVFANVASAQDGANDPSFNPGDAGFGNGTNTAISAVAVQPDGKIIAVGHFTHYNNSNVGRIVRINADESQDMSFIQGDGANGQIRAVQILPDGKIIIGGDFTSYNGITRNRIARLNADGSLDETFDPEGGANNPVQTIKLQQDGKILIGGLFTQYNGTSANRMARLNDDGTKDVSFSVNVSGNVRQIAFQADGKIVIGGDFTFVNESQLNYIARLNSNGTTDTSFMATGANFSVYSLLVVNDKIFVGGAFWSFNGVEAFGLVRLNLDGSIDSSFVPGVLGGGYVLQMVQQPDGKIIAAGVFEGFNGDSSVRNVVRFSEDGVIDTFIPFGAEGLITSVALKPDGKVIFAGSFLIFNNYPENHIVSYNSDGSRDVSFDIGAGTGADNTIFDSAMLADGKILIAGDFFNYNGVARKKIARIDADGNLDTSFNPGLGANGSIKKIAVMENGKIIIAGDFTTYDGQTARNVARLNSDGSLDLSFSAGSDFYISQLKALAVQGDGKVVMGGHLVIQNSQPLLSTIIWRLNQDGTLDTGFNYSQFYDDAGYSGMLTKIIVLENSKILVARNTVVTDGVPLTTIVRLNVNGTFDSQFMQVPGNILGLISDMALQPDGKIVAVGTDWVSSSPSVNKMLRFNSDGTPDTTFGTISPDLLSGSMNIAVQNDGKIVITGRYDVVNNSTSHSIVRLNADGAVDPGFEDGAGADGWIYKVLMQGDKAIILGSFNEYNGIGRNRIARIFSTGSLGTDQPEVPSDKIIAYKNGSVLDIASVTGEINDVKVFDLNGRLVAAQKDINATSTEIKGLAGNSIYIVKVRLSDNREVTKKIYY